MSHQIVFYEIIEIVCAMIALGLEGYAYYNDRLWNLWLNQFDYNINRMCVHFGRRTSDLVPHLNSTGYFGDLDTGPLYMGMFFRNTMGETWFLTTETIILILICIHLVYTCKSSNIVARATYAAYLHSATFCFLIPITIRLASIAFDVENSYKIMAAYHPQCINIVFCKENGDLQEEVSNTKSHEIKLKFTDMHICQLFWFKAVAAIFGGIHTLLSFVIVFTAMSVIARNDENAVGESRLSEQAEDRFKAISRKPSTKGRYFSELALPAQSSANTVGGKVLSIQSSGKNSIITFHETYLTNKDYDDDAVSDVQGVSPYHHMPNNTLQTMYREYKFRKQRIAEMEREQNMAEDARLSQPGCVYANMEEVIKELEESDGRKHVFRKPKVVNLVPQNPELVAPERKHVENVPAAVRKAAKRDKVTPIEKNEENTEDK